MQVKITVSVSNAFTVIKLDLTVTVTIGKNVPNASFLTSSIFSLSSLVCRYYYIFVLIVKLQVLDRGLGVDFTFTLDNNDNDNPHLYFLKGTVLGDMEQKIVLLLVANGVVSMIGDHSGTSLLKLQMD